MLMPPIISQEMSLNNGIKWAIRALSVPTCLVSGLYGLAAISITGLVGYDPRPAERVALAVWTIGLVVSYHIFTLRIWPLFVLNLLALYLFYTNWGNYTDFRGEVIYKFWIMVAVFINLLYLFALKRRVVRWF
jgi:hypothetical protein